MREYLQALDAGKPAHEGGAKYLSPTDPAAAWNTKEGRGKFGYFNNYLVDTDHAVIVDSRSHSGAYPTIYELPSYVGADLSASNFSSIAIASSIAPRIWGSRCRVQGHVILKSSFKAIDQFR